MAAPSIPDRWAGKRLVAATRLERHEQRLRTAIRRPLTEARKAALAHVEAMTAALPVAGTLASALSTAARPVMESIVSDLSADNARAFGLDLPAYDLTGRLERVDALVSELGVDTVANLDRTLTEGANLGESIPDLAKRVKDVFDASDFRATNIARTEVVGASNGIGNDQANMAAGLGLSLWKTWLATSDDRTRPDHAEADGQTVPLSEPFEVGDDLLMYPGDPDGSAEEVCMCRCTTTYDDQPGDGGGDEADAAQQEADAQEAADEAA